METTNDDTAQILGQEVRMLEGRLFSAKEMLRIHSGASGQVGQLPPMGSLANVPLTPRRPETTGSHAKRPRPATANAADNAIGLSPLVSRVGVNSAPGRDQAPPRSGIYHGESFDALWQPGTVLPIGAPSSRLVLNKDVKKHRAQWEVLHRCQRMFRLADELWQVGDEQRRNIHPEKLMSIDHETANARLRKARDQLVQIAHEIYDGPVTGGEGGDHAEAKSDEKRRLRRLLAESEGKSEGLEISNAAYVRRHQTMTTQNGKLRRHAVRGWLDVHFVSSVAPAFQGWVGALSQAKWERYKSQYPLQLMTVLGQTLQRLGITQNEALLDSCLNKWITITVEIRRAKKIQRDKEARRKRVKAADRAFSEGLIVLQVTSLRAWQVAAKDLALKARRRKLIMDSTMRKVQKSGEMLLGECALSWVDLVRNNRARRAGKDKLLQGMLQKIGAGERQDHHTRFLAWVGFASTQKAERQLEESLARELNSRLKKMKMIEKSFKGDVENTFYMCWKAWYDEFKVGQLQKRFKQNAMDSTMKRILGLQVELMTMCFNDWVSDIRELSAQRKRGQVEETRRRALEQFQKSLDANIAGLKQMFLMSWREQAELAKIRMKKKKDMMDRAAASMAGTEMLVKMLFPLWVKESQQGNFLKKSATRLKSSMERSRAFIIKLRDKTILEVVWIGWHFRTFG